MAETQKKGISAHEETLSNFIWMPTIFEVPPYQRNYSWEVEQVSALWRDVLRTAQGTDSYFLGSAVFVRTDNSMVFELLDGQQRFASLNLMFAAFRALFKERHPQSKFLPIVQSALTTMDLSGKFGNTDTPRLRLNERDREFFRSIVEDGKIPESKHSSHKLMAKAYETYYENIVAQTEQTTVDVESLWSLLVEAFSQRLYIIRIEVDDLVDAQMIFEALNSAGMDLTQADLIKNYLIREAPAGEKDSAHKAWLGIGDAVEDDSRLTTYIRTFWNSAFGFVRKGQLYKALTKRVVKPPLKDEQIGVMPFLRQMEEESIDWIALHSYSIPGTGATIEQINQDLQDLRDMGAALVLVPLLALKRVYKSEMEAFRKCVRWFRNFYVRHTIVAGRAANELEELYTQWALSIRRGKMGPEALHAELAKRSPSNEDFRSSFKELEIKSPKVARLMLARINDSFDLENAITKTISAGGRIHLEHIIPQKPEKWETFLQSEGLDHSDCVNNIGNLTLLVGSKNIKISNSEFLVKREKAYSFEGNIAPINQMLAKADKFGKSELSARQELLAEKALEVWRLSM